MDFAADIKPADTDLTFKWDGQRTIEVVRDGAPLEGLEVAPGHGYDQVFFDDAVRVIEAYLAATGATARLPRSGHEETLRLLKEIATSIKHVGDYGETFWNHETGVVHWVGGDSDGDEEEGYTGFGEIRTRFVAVPGVTEVVIADEYFPEAYDHDVTRPEDTASNDTEGWVYIGRGKEYVGHSMVEDGKEASIYFAVNRKTEEKLNSIGVKTFGELAVQKRTEIAALGVNSKDLESLDRVLEFRGLSWSS